MIQRPVTEERKFLFLKTLRQTGNYGAACRATASQEGDGRKPGYSTWRYYRQRNSEFDRACFEAIEMAVLHKTTKMLERRWGKNISPDKRAYLKTLFRNARSRAQKKNMEFTLTLDDLLPIPTYCPVLGIPLDWQRGGKRTPNTPSLDRVFSEFGYVSGNVVIISWKANNLKSNLTLSELYSIYEYMIGFI